MTHDCPGGCGAQVPRHRLACESDWFRLPAVLRNEITYAYRRRTKEPSLHRRLLREAFLWYRHNPRGARGE